VNEIVQRHRLEDFLWLRYDHHTTRPQGAYKDRPAYVKQDHQGTVEVRVDEEALERAVRRLGWRVYSTNQPDEQLSLEQVKIPAASCGAFREPHQTSSVAHFEDFSGTGYTDE
jgi:hypothetical protein